MLKSEINMERACRSCLEETTNVFKIHDSVDIDTTYTKSSFTIAEILMECTAIKIMPDDDLPQNICTNCTVKVQEAFSYKKMCEENDEKLRAYLRSRIVCEPQLFGETNEQHTSSPEIEKIHISDLFVPDDLLDEHDDLHDDDDDDDDFGNNTHDIDYGSDTRNFDDDGAADDDDDDDDDYEDDEIQIKKRAKKTKTTTEQSEGNVTRSEYRMGEDFQVLNNAKKINGRYQCEMCEKTLADRRTFLLHTRLHLGKNLKHCDICGKGFAKKNHLDRHLAVHMRKGSKAIKRKRATEFSGDKKRACKKPAALESSHPGDSANSVAEVADANTTIGNTTIKQEKPANDNEQLPNANAAADVGDQDEMNLVKSAVQVSGGRIQCPICPRTLSHRKILRLHIRSHLGKNLSHCKICNRGFAKGSNLNRHMLLHCRIDRTEESRILQSATQKNGCYSCPYCAKTLIDRQTFRLHIRLHISKTLIRCEICNRAFDDDTELEKHMACHGNEFPCNHCDQIFSQFGARKEHIRMAHIAEVEEQFDRTEREPNRRSGGKTKSISNDADAHGEDDEDKHIVEKSECVNGRYECVFCKKTLANRTTLKYHIRLHLGKHLLKCDVCNQGFSKKSHLKRHIATHSKKKPCRFCDEVFETYEDRRLHTIAAHKDATLNPTNKTIIPMWTQANGAKYRHCIICKMEFERISELKSHIDWHISNPKSLEAIDCAANEEMCEKFGIQSGNYQDFCQTLYTKIQEDPAYMANLYSITNESGWELSISDSETENEDYCNENEAKYSCGKCERHFDRLHKLMCHMKVDHSAHTQEFQEFKCSYCMQCFPNQSVLAKHLRQQCENKTKSAVCLMCNNRFTWKSNLEKHVAIYHEADSKYMPNTQNQVVRPYKCNQYKCNKSFYRPEQLETHKSIHMPRPKRFTCDICKKRFSRTDNLKSHMRVHVPMEEREVVNKHLCSYCGRSFSNSSNLTVHIRRHTGERPFSCEFCDARFPRSSDLQCHRRTHTGEKTCVCTVCGKGFTRSNKLVRHMRIHTGERPYKCPHCDRAFTQSNDLTLHVRRHTGDKPFGCICGERFITNSLLQMHRRSTGHVDETVNYLSTLPSNSVNNPHRKWKDTDGKRTGITATLSGITNLQQQPIDQDEKFHTT